MFNGVWNVMIHRRLGIGRCSGRALFACWAALLLVALGLSAASGAESRQDEDAVRVHRVSTPGYVSLIVENQRAYDVTVVLTVVVENVRTIRMVPETYTYAGNSRIEAVRVAAGDTSRPWRWQYRFQWTKGRLNAEHDDVVRYLLPFERGRSHRVSQGHNGRLTHRDCHQYAVDFAMPEGTRVCAAREGVVVDLREDSKIGGPSRRYKDSANFVSIVHADSTIGEYHHLRFGGVLVEIGDRIAAGQLIALSGNTGYSTLPHLHFGVYSAADAEHMQSHPVIFDTRQGPVADPREGMAYTAK